MKLVNRTTANEFHDWQRSALPDTLVIQDLDAWAVTVADPSQIVALIELKRSSIAVAAWRPFAADRPNYAALLNLARAAAVPLYVVYFQKGVPIEGDTQFHVFRLDEAAPDYRGARRVMTAEDFAQRFPYPIQVAA